MQIIQAKGSIFFNMIERDRYNERPSAIDRAAKRIKRNIWVDVVVVCPKCVINVKWIINKKSFYDNWVMLLAIKELVCGEFHWNTLVVVDGLLLKYSSVCLILFISSNFWISQCRHQKNKTKQNRFKSYQYPKSNKNLLQIIEIYIEKKKRLVQK